MDAILRLEFKSPCNRCKPVVDNGSSVETKVSLRQRKDEASVEVEGGKE